MGYLCHCMRISVYASGIYNFKRSGPFKMILIIGYTYQGAVKPYLQICTS